MKANSLKIIVAALSLLAVNAWGQEFKLSKSSGKLIVKDVNKVEFEGTSGNEIIFSTDGGSRSTNERAEGLRIINAMGLEDNTGIGLSVTDKGGNIEVYQLSKMSSKTYTIKVPKGVSIVYEHSGTQGSKVKFTRVESEISTSTLHNGVILKDVTGPMTINSVHGSIDVVFSEVSQKSPASIISVHGPVDVTLPSNTKANLKIHTNWGEVFASPDLKIEFEQSGDMKRYGGSDMRAKLNGGGVEMTLSSTHNNIYLRKK
ncbi:MAG TPA: hypothetical protein PKC24_14865 [Cyclobacteriaceae bacterium]|nr:hypothetical protein [Cyclobacteriaceae bacterium]